MLTLSKILWVACLVAQGAVLARLITAGLLRRSYRFFGAYVSWGILSGLILVWIPFTSPSYAHAWVVLEPLFSVLAFASVWECYHAAVAAHQPSDRYFVLAIAGVLSITFSLFSLTVELHSLSRMSAYYWVILLDRVQAFGMALFLGGLWLVFRQFPISRKANTGLHWRLLFFYGLLNSIAFMIIAMSSGRLVNLGNAVGQACSLVLYIIWAWKLSASGEIEVIASVLDPNDEDNPDQKSREITGGSGSFRISDEPASEHREGR